MRRRIYVFCVLAAIMAVVFTRLGLWQVERLHERQAYNRNFIRQQVIAPVPFAQLPKNPDSVRYRGAYLEGAYDYAHELILSPRTRRGSPGVDLLTPVRRAGNDTAVLVNRGWVYSPDLATVDQARWRERDTATVRGYAERYMPDSGVTHSGNPSIIRHVTRAELAAKLPYPVAPYYLVAAGDTADLSHPARRDLPELDEGPHLNYAIQWFTFALISVVGAGIVVYRERSVRKGWS